MSVWFCFFCYGLCIWFSPSHFFLISLWPRRCEPGQCSGAQLASAPSTLRCSLTKSRWLGAAASSPLAKPCSWGGSACLLLTSAQHGASCLIWSFKIQTSPSFLFFWLFLKFNKAQSKGKPELTGYARAECCLGSRQSTADVLWRGSTLLGTAVAESGQTSRAACCRSRET